MTAKKPPQVDLPAKSAGAPVDELRLARVQRELSGLQQQLARMGGPQAKQSGAVLAQVAKLAQQLAAAGAKGPEDPEAAKALLREQAQKVQALLRGLEPPKKPDGG